MNGLRQFFVKSNLLYDLETQLLKAESIYDYILHKRAALQVKLIEDGYNDVDGLREAYGKVKKELKDKLTPYQDGKPVPPELKEELQPVEDQRKQMEKDIDDYDDYEAQLKEKRALVEETTYYIVRLNQQGNSWLKSAHQAGQTGVPYER